MSLYFSAVTFFWTAIQPLRFWAVSPQDTMAYLPLLPMTFASWSTSAVPMPSVEACETNAERTELGASVSEVRTLMPASFACWRTGAMESGSLGATMSVSTFCWM